MFDFTKMNYVVKNSNGGTLGYYKTFEDALKCKTETEKRYAADPFGNSKLKVFIEKF